MHAVSVKVVAGAGTIFGLSALQRHSNIQAEHLL
jgi:hypothetical protein